ncbi:MAG: hypothetical protein JXQ91_15700 [Vannielia sp.]|uniref:hypothetical protein n=1 Tax=Vannielia sp. TaxID=2813045 RepID=UPI003B8DF820
MTRVAIAVCARAQRSANSVSEKGPGWDKVISVESCGQVFATLPDFSDKIRSKFGVGLTEKFDMLFFG